MSRHPMRWFRLFRPLVPLLALAAAACDGAAEPSGVEGRYSVHSVNGRPPPALVTTTFSGAVQVVDARLELDAPEATVELETRLVSANGAAGATTRTTYSGTYQASGDVITFGTLEPSDEGPGVRAEGVVISPREVVVTLHFAVASSQGYFTYPVSLILRR
jgi:hypothetical protein